MIILINPFTQVMNLIRLNYTIIKLFFLRKATIENKIPVYLFFFINILFVMDF